MAQNNPGSNQEAIRKSRLALLQSRSRLQSNKLAGKAGKKAGQAVGSLTGGPVGTAVGGVIGSALAKRSASKKGSSENPITSMAKDQLRRVIMTWILGALAALLPWILLIGLAAVASILIITVIL